MPSLRSNITANLLGRGWAGLVSLLLLPLYLRYLGIEGYGLVGLQTSLVALFSVLDFGLSTAINRAFAASSAKLETVGEMRSTLTTLELVYWGLALAVGGATAAGSQFIATHWIRPDQLSPHTVQTAVALMGLTIACQWPGALYSGGLMGLEQQVVLNFLQGAMTLIRAVGALAVLALVSSTVEAFFLWQAVASLGQTLLTAALLRRRLPSSAGRNVFSFRLLRRLTPFAAGMFGVSAAWVLLTQIDKVVLSRLLSLEAFGYYTVAATAASALFQLVAPVQSAVFPRFARLSSTGDWTQLTRIYHASCQTAAVAVLPVAAIVAGFASTLLELWTRNSLVAQNGHLVLALLIVGNALNAMLYVPYALQVAAGRVSLVMLLNLSAAVLMVVLVVFLSARYGGSGAAAAWLVGNAALLIIGMSLMHRWLLQGELLRWYRSDFVPPALGSSVVAVLAVTLMPAGLGNLFELAWIVGGFACALIVAALVTGEVRSRILLAVVPGAVR
jgi:O-antigen/teichoic acid export membrane protein